MRSPGTGPIRAVDFCCGAGGWAAAARGLPIQFVAAADLASDCLETWQVNHATANPDCKLVKADLSTAAGMRALHKAAGKNVDLVLGAIPCEQISTARANRPLKPGELEAVHALIDQAFAYVGRSKPHWWCFEDVTAIERHLPLPIELCSRLRYECRRIDASFYGPQKRVRTFFGQFPFPANPEPGPRVLADVLRPGPYRTLPELAKYERTNSKWYGGNKCRVLSPESAGGTVLSSMGGMGSRSERSAMVPVQATDMWPRSCDRPMLADEPARCVADGKGGGKGLPVHAPGLVRVMEWQEAALLQGFPPDYIFAASWSRTWKMVSQAIPVYVGRAILRAIICERGSRSNAQA